MLTSKYDLIVAIVNKDSGSTVVEAAKSAGAPGATLITGRGSGTQDVLMLFEIPLQPEKDIVLSVVPDDVSQDIMAAMVKSANIEKPGAGIAFIVPIKSIAGIPKE